MFQINFCFWRHFIKEKPLEVPFIVHDSNRIFMGTTWVAEAKNMNHLFTMGDESKESFCAFKKQ